jgi:hypothetical protein
MFSASLIFLENRFGKPESELDQFSLVFPTSIRPLPLPGQEPIVLANFLDATLDTIYGPIFQLTNLPLWCCIVD